MIAVVQPLVDQCTALVYSAVGLTTMDHVLAAVIMVVLPVRGYLTFPAVKRKLAENKPGIRVRMYRRTMTWQWSLTAITVGAWLAAGRTLPELGFTWPRQLSTWLAAVVVLVIIGLMSAQLAALPKHPDVHAAVREQLEGAAPFLPRTADEQSWFSGVAVTAGVCEEVLFRGFCLAYVSAWVGLPAAIAVTSIVFGLGHLYQGARGALKTGIAGLVAGGIFAWSGTLWLPIVLHVFVDIHGGLVHRIVRPR